MRNNKKSQIAVFIIIGMALLVFIAFFIYLNSEGVEEQQRIALETTESIPEEFSPVKAYIGNVLLETAKQGVLLAEQHAGHITADAFTIIPNSPTESEALDMVRGFAIPYWHYLASSNGCTDNCVFASHKPPLCKPGRDCISSGQNSIEEQLENYIVENLPANLDYAPLEGLGFGITVLSEPTAEVLIRDNDIAVTINYRHNAESDGRKQDITVFQAVFESDLAEFYQLASDITSYAQNNCFLEQSAMNYFSGFMGLSDGALPPTDGRAEIGTSSPHQWSIRDVEDMLRPKTKEAVARIGFFNTSGFVWPETDEAGEYEDLYQGLLDQQVFYAITSGYHEATAKASYVPIWQPYLNIRPHNSAGILTPDEFGGGIPLLDAFTKTKMYKFSYDYSFPVLLRIEKENKAKEAHTFIFALEANIRANRCLHEGISIRQQANVGATGICEEAFRTHALELTVIDDRTGQPLPGARVSFDILASESCPQGATSAQGKAEVSYPPVYGDSAFITIEKEGYARASVSQREFSGRNSFEVRIRPTKELYVELWELANESYSLMNSAGSLYSATALRESLARPANASGFASIDITTGYSGYQEQHQRQAVVFSGGNFSPQTIRLVPGIYNISIFLESRENVSIPEEHERFCVETGLFGGCERYESIVKPAYSITGGYLAGGAEIVGWSIPDYGALESAQVLRLYLFRHPIPLNYGDLQEMHAIYKDRSQMNPSFITPELVS
ncbi:TPA: hypothetical protein HA361_04375 [Candidatus Woesearchaeota archaeon]|nr:hypothetical protein [Candidatus Woesearchaeota archaeon]HII68462.1 hypothetical protein [Candidatus Woesearchaeota archaeon]